MRINTLLFKIMLYRLHLEKIGKISTGKTPYYHVKPFIFDIKLIKTERINEKRLFRQPFLYTFLLCAEATCNDQCTVLSLSLSAACPVYRNIHRVFSLIPDSRNRLNITANHLMIENQQRQQIDSSCISVATFHSIS